MYANVTERHRIPAGDCQLSNKNSFTICKAHSMICYADSWRSESQIKSTFCIQRNASIFARTNTDCETRASDCILEFTHTQIKHT